MSRAKVFDEKHRSVIRWLIKEMHFSDGEVARLMMTDRHVIRYLRIEMKLDANSAPGKRIKKRLAMYETTH